MSSYENAAKATTELLDSMISSQELPGIQYIVLDATGVLYEYANGHADTKFQTPVTPNTWFLSASCTKTVTAAAILKLYERGKLELDDPLSKYYSDHPYGDELTIRHLLNQSSGVPNPMPLSWFHTAEQHPEQSEAQALQAALEANSKLDFQPGSKYVYSNLSYWLLGKVVEAVSGITYREYLRTEVLAPLDIGPTEMDCELPTVTNEDATDILLARGHQPRFSLTTLIFWFLIPSDMWADSVGSWCRYQFLYMKGPSYGGLFATARGYAKFLQDLLPDNRNCRLFEKPSTKEAFFSEQRDASGNLMPTTLGWHRGYTSSSNDRGSSKGHLYFGKPGGGPGYHSDLRIYPELGLATVFLANKTEVSEGPINRLSDRLDQAFLAETSLRTQK